MPDQTGKFLAIRFKPPPAPSPAFVKIKLHFERHQKPMDCALSLSDCCAIIAEGRRQTRRLLTLRGKVLSPETGEKGKRP